MSKSTFFLIENLNKDFGGIHALKALDLKVSQGEIHGIIGPNGAGKTTLINVITGLEKPSKGKIFYKGHRIDHLPPEEIFKKGISRTFQEGKVVTGLTVLENVISGLDDRGGKNIFQYFLNLFLNSMAKEEYLKKKGRGMLKRFNLLSMSDRWAEDLVWVERQLVQIARSVISDPDFLLLDEPTAGMGNKEKKRIVKQILSINQAGITLIIVSHDVKFIRRLSHRITVLDFGQKISQGLPQEVLNDPKVWEIYLGEKQSSHIKN